MKFKLEYSIRNRKTQRLYEMRTLEIDEDMILDGCSEYLTGSIGLNMEDEWEFTDFNLIATGQYQ